MGSLKQLGKTLLTTLISGIFLMNFLSLEAAARVAQAKTAPKFDENLKIFPGSTQVEVNAKQAIIIDFKTGKVLLEKNADERMTPSSMTKMMTSYLLEEAIINKKISSESEFKVSEKAWRTQGSKMFVPVHEAVKVADLHRGIAIQSGNDASIVVAEGLLGTEEGFAIEMNRMALKLGMKDSNFKNASGLHENGHYSTARDLSKLAVAIIKNHPQFYTVNQEKEFKYNNINQQNRNPLLFENIGCDGIKTGHTDEGGFGVAASCVDGDMRLVMVINGLPSINSRAAEAKKLVGWAKANFIGKTVIKKGQKIEVNAPVINGVVESVPLVAADDLYLVMLSSEQDQLKLSPALNGALAAPVAKDLVAGKMVASLGQSLQFVELKTAEPVEKLNWFKRLLRRFGWA